MNQRTLINTLLASMALAAGWAILAQHHDLALLRAHYQQVQAETAAGGDAPPGEAGLPAGSAVMGISPELLKLRSEVTRLTQRQKELEPIRLEHEKLRAQETGMQTNGAPAEGLPEGYIRKAQARMVGYGSPEATLQSLLWAVQNRDLTNVVRALPPALGNTLLSQGANSEFFANANTLPGLGILKQDTTADGDIWATVIIAPGFPHLFIHFKAIGGEWRIMNLNEM
jgi:hypothetical protein